MAKLARKRGVSKQDAVRLAVQAELDRIREAIPLRERIAAWRKEHPMPPPTGTRMVMGIFTAPFVRECIRATWLTIWSNAG